MKIRTGLSNFIRCLEQRRFEIEEGDERVKCEGTNLAYPVYLYPQKTGFRIDTPLLKVFVNTEIIEDYRLFMNLIYKPDVSMLALFKYDEDIQHITWEDSSCFKRTPRYGEVNLNRKSIVFYPGFVARDNLYSVALAATDERDGSSHDLVSITAHTDLHSARDYFLHTLYDVSNSNPQLETLISKASKPRKLGSRIIL